MTNRPLGAAVRYIRTLTDGQATAAAADGQLLGRFVRLRDEAAFAALLRRHGPMVLAVCRRVLGRLPDAEDAFQATFLLLARKASSIRKRESVGSWLHGVAHHVALKAKGRDDRRRILERQAGAMRKTPTDVTAAWGDLQDVLDEALQRLPERYRSPLVICHLEGRTHEEAARQLACPIATLRSRLTRGRKLLRTELTRRGVTLSAGALGAALLVSTAEAAPPLLLDATLKAALLFAVGGTAAGAVSSSAAALANQALKAMGIMKMKIMVIVLAALSLVGAGIGVMAQPAAKPPEEKTPKTKAASAPRAEKDEQARLDDYGDPLPDGAVARIGSLQLRHVGLNGFHFLADGKTLLTTGRDGMLRFWDVATGRQLRSVRPPDEVRWSDSLTLLADGKTAVAHSGKELVYVFWEITSGKVLKRVPVGEQRRSYEYFSPDGRTLALGDDAGRLVTLLDLERQTKHSFGEDNPPRTSGDATTHGRFSPDGRWFAMNFHHELPTRVIDVARGKEQYRLDGHAYTSAFTPDGKFLVTLSMKGAITPGKVSLIFWDMATGKESQRLELDAADFEFLWGLAFTSDGKTIVCSSGEKTRLIDRASGRELRTMKAWLSSIFISPDDHTLAGQEGRRLRLWDMQTGKELNPRPGECYRSNAVALSPDGRFAATAMWTDHEVSLWDAVTGRRLHFLELEGENPSVQSLTFTGDGDTLAACQYEGALQYWDVAAGKELRAVQLEGADKGNIVPPGRQMSNLHLSPDGQQVSAVTGPVDPKDAVWLQVWDAKSGKLLKDKSCPSFNNFTWGEDGASIAVCRPDGVTVVDLTTGLSVARMPGKWHAPLAVSGDGRLACALSDKNSTPRTVHVWEVATGKEITALAAGAPSVAAFAAAGRCLVTTDPTSLCVWDLATGKLRRRWSAPDAPGVRKLCLSADSRRAMTTQEDGTLLIWDLTRALRDGEPLASAATEKDLAAWWADLAGADAAKAYAAVWRMMEAPDLTLPFLRTRLKAVAEADLAQVRGPLADLDSDNFDMREKASWTLAEMGSAALPALRHALAKDPSAEVRRRLETLLASVTAHVRVPDDLRRFRAVAILEGIGSPDARVVLKKLAEGIPEAEQTNEAKKALARLEIQSHVGPP